MGRQYNGPRESSIRKQQLHLNVAYVFPSSKPHPGHQGSVLSDQTVFDIVPPVAVLVGPQWDRRRPLAKRSIGRSY